METAFSDPAQQPDSSPEPKMELATLTKEAQEILTPMLQMLSFEARQDARIEEGIVHIHLECEDAGRLIGRRGTTINELQFLLNRILQRRHKTVPRVFLDVDSAAQPEAPPLPPVLDANPELMAKVKSVFDQVRRWGEAKDLGALNAADRKALQDMLARDRELEIVPLDGREDASGFQKMRLQVKQK